MIREVLNVRMISSDPIFCESIEIGCEYRHELTSAADEQ